MTVKLNHRIGKDLMTLRDALQQCASALIPVKPRETVALLYAPDRCLLATLAVESQGNDLLVRLLNEQGNEIAASRLDTVFEARVFNQTAEFRWLHRAEGKGSTALLSEQDISACLSPVPLPESEYDRLDELEKLDHCYLLWGEGAGLPPSNGWHRLTTARIGYLDIPLTEAKLESGNRVQLRAREYLREVDEHGNVAVVEERLLKLEVAKQ